MHLTWCLRVQVEALDRDAGENGRVEYSLMETASTKGRFRIHPHSGIVYAQKSLAAGQEFSFSVSLGYFLLFERTISTNHRPGFGISVFEFFFFTFHQSRQKVFPGRSSFPFLSIVSSYSPHSTALGSSSKFSGPGD